MSKNTDIIPQRYYASPKKGQSSETPNKSVKQQHRSKTSRINKNSSNSNPPKKKETPLDYSQYQELSSTPATLQSSYMERGKAVTQAVSQVTGQVVRTAAIATLIAHTGVFGKTLQGYANTGIKFVGSFAESAVQGAAKGVKIVYDYCRGR